MTRDDDVYREDPQPMPVFGEDQLDPDDSLLDDDLSADPLDEGYAPPDRWSPAEYEDPARQLSLDEQLAEEQPDSADPYADENLDRAGRLVQDGTDTSADDLGIDGGASSAEEAAMHLED